MSVLCLGSVMDRDVARVLEQIKSCLRFASARFLCALNTNTALLNISFSLSGSSPEYCSFVSVVKEEREKERTRTTVQTCPGCLINGERERQRVRQNSNSKLYFTRIVV